MLQESVFHPELGSHNDYGKTTMAERSLINSPHVFRLRSLTLPLVTMFKCGATVRAYPWLLMGRDKKHSPRNHHPMLSEGMRHKANSTAAIKVRSTR